MYTCFCDFNDYRRSKSPKILSKNTKAWFEPFKTAAEHKVYSNHHYRNSHNSVEHSIETIYITDIIITRYQFLII